MVIKGNQMPTIQEEVIWRPKDLLELFDRELINDTVPRRSDGIECAPFRKFGLYCDVEFDGTADTINLHIEVEFLDRWTSRWYTYKQGLFAALFYEDVDTKDRIFECFQGDVLGRDFRVKLTGIGVSDANHFHVSIGVDFWN